MATTFDREWKEIEPTLVSLAMRLCSNRQDAEGIMQMAAVRCWQHFERIESERSMLNYACRVVQNLHRDLLRKQARRPATLAIESGLPDQFDALLTYDAKVDADLMADALRDQIGRFGTSAKQIIVAVTDGETTRSFADKSGMTRTAASTRLSRTRETLRRDPGIRSFCIN